MSWADNSYLKDTIRTYLTSTIHCYLLPTPSEDTKKICHSDQPMQLNKPPKFPCYFVENTLKIFQVVYDGETLTKTYESATQA